MLKLISTILSLFNIVSWFKKLFKPKPESTPYEKKPVQTVVLSRQDRRDYARYCKKHGIATLSRNLPRHVTLECHRVLKKRGIIK